MDINIKGDPGTGNTFISVQVNKGGTYQHLPNVTEVNNTTNIYGDCKKKASAPADDKEKQIIKSEILDYVGQLKEYVHPDWTNKYDTLWVSILAIPEVDEAIYKKGSQKNTTFNRQLVGNIIHVLIPKVISETNRTKLCKTLEGKEHDIRKQMSLNPSEEIIKAVKELIE